MQNFIVFAIFSIRSLFWSGLLGYRRMFLLTIYLYSRLAEDKSIASPDDIEGRAYFIRFRFFCGSEIGRD